MHGLQPDPAMVSFFEGKLETKMPGFEALLGKQKYIAGDVNHSFKPCRPSLADASLQKLTIVDFFFLSNGKAITDLGYDYLVNEEKYPNISRWWKDVSTRESWQTIKDSIPREWTAKPSLESQQRH